ncbi:MAG: Txe/YoeB family addiction module toxin [Flavobacteriaceae bacterium]|jgi:toxin YoeB|nr:Txe/YoeB family addiction module toxin [Flavobacteriaceae bacterium]
MSFEIELTEHALEDLEFWKSDSKTLKKIKRLLTSMSETPFKGIGKPEPLKYDLSGYWSRRIDLENRIVYKVENNSVIVIQMRYHY